MVHKRGGEGGSQCAAALLQAAHQFQVSGTVKICDYDHLSRSLGVQLSCFASLMQCATLAEVIENKKKKSWVAEVLQRQWSEYLWGMRKWASYEVRYDAKITSLSEEGIFPSAGREGMRVGYGFYEICLNALSSCCHPVARVHKHRKGFFKVFMRVLNYALRRHSWGKAVQSW